MKASAKPSSQNVTGSATSTRAEIGVETGVVSRLEVVESGDLGFPTGVIPAQG